MAEAQIVEHPFDPVYTPDSKVLILGSLPSVASRQQNFYYGHPQNRFWKLLAAIFEEDIPKTIEEKTAFLNRHQIALWDVIAKCSIENSSDASIRNAVPNDLNRIFKAAKIQAVICNGQAAAKLYKKHQEQKSGLPCLVLPSTSPANAAYSLERLISCWKEPLLHALETEQPEQDRRPA